MAKTMVMSPPISATAAKTVKTGLIPQLSTIQPTRMGPIAEPARSQALPKPDLLARSCVVKLGGVEVQGEGDGLQDGVGDAGEHHHLLCGYGAERGEDDQRDGGGQEATLYQPLRPTRSISSAQMSTRRRPRLR